VNDLKIKIGTLAISSALALTMFATSAMAFHGGGGGFADFVRTRFYTVMTGSEEAPGPGDPDGFGIAKVNVLTDQVCVDLKVRRIATATAAHIHEAPEGTPGPVVVGLPTPDVSGHSSGCVSIATSEAQEIRENPENYYVNVHNGEYPNGAVRGQLR
jgi:hypothetical protein